MKLRYLAMTLLIMLLAVGVSAHMPGAAPPPEFEMAPILVYDGDENPVEITIDDVAEYHGLCTGQGASKCVCNSWTFRALQTGIGEVWGDEIPQRSDIAITTPLTSLGGIQTMQYVTGTGKNVDAKTKGKFSVVLPDGTEVTDFSKKHIMALSRNNSPEKYRLTVTRISTGDSSDIVTNDGIFADDYFDLRLKSKITKNITPEESKKFLQEYTDARDTFLTAPSSELFVGIEDPEEEPDLMGGFAFIAFLIVMVGAVFAISRKK